MKVFILAALSTFYGTTLAQNFLPWNNTDNYYITLDGSVIEQRVHNSRTKKKILWNSSPLDSTGLAFDQFIFTKGKINPYGFLSTNDQTILFQVSKKGLKKVIEFKDKMIPYDQYFYDENIWIEDSNNIILFNPVKLTSFKLIDLNSYGAYSLVEIFFSPTNDLVVVSLGEDVGGGYDIYYYLLINTKTQAVKDITKEFMATLPP